MTQFEKAQSLLDSLVVYAAAEGATLPTLQYPQVGDPVIACPVVTVALTSVVPHDGYGPVGCNASQLATFSVIIARECANTANYDGTDNPAAVATVSAQADADGEVLWGWVSTLTPYLSIDWSIGWTITGGLGITSLQMTTGVD